MVQRVLDDMLRRIDAAQKSYGLSLEADLGAVDPVQHFIRVDKRIHLSPEVAAETSEEGFPEHVLLNALLGIVAGVHRYVLVEDLSNVGGQNVHLLWVLQCNRFQGLSGCLVDCVESSLFVVIKATL